MSLSVRRTVNTWSLGASADAQLHAMSLSVREAPARICQPGSSYARPIDPVPDPFEIDVRVIPRSNRDEVGGERAGRLLVRTTAVPVDDKANASVCKLVAAFFAVRQRDVQVVSGHRSRDKTLRVTR